jgi:hypothetical protein
MSKTWLRALLVGPLLLLLGLGLVGTVRYFDWLDQRRLAGVCIIGLAFGALALLGIWLQLGDEFGPDDPPGAMVRRFLVFVAWMGLFIPTFLGGIWLLLLAVTGLLSPFLPDWIVGTVFVIAFTWYIAGVLKVLGWLADREIIGSTPRRGNETE